ncbi:MAG: hypothetical protein ABL957_14840 [Parvularculaceae bacterium]
MTTVKNKDVQALVGAEVSRILQKLGEHHKCSVVLKGPSNKKSASANFKLNSKTDSMVITFEPQPPSEASADEVHDGSAQKRDANVGPPLSNLVDALNRAEARPGFDFISLKWFRDTALLNEDFDWAADEAARHNALAAAIDRRLILTKKVRNPKSPQFPVTAIYLNRSAPEVKAILGLRRQKIPDFNPIVIRGEALSASILRDRR